MHAQDRSRPGTGASRRGGSPAGRGRPARRRRELADQGRELVVVRDPRDAWPLTTSVGVELTPAPSAVVVRAVIAGGRRLRALHASQAVRSTAAASAMRAMNAAS